MCRNKAALFALIGNKGKSANAVSARANLPLRAFPSRPLPALRSLARSRHSLRSAPCQGTRGKRSRDLIYKAVH